MWFEKLMGFSEQSPQQVRDNILLEKETLTSRVNGKKYNYGSLQIPSLAELRRQVDALTIEPGNASICEIKADVQQLHLDETNAGALFQVASQFNLLEMVSPEVNPEHGVAGYEYDRTQGPACAIAAGAGTIYRNYFADVDGRQGQSATHQIDCLAGLGVALGNHNNRLWQMKNGYALATNQGLQEISQRLESAVENEKDELRKCLRIGLQWHTQVTLNDFQHLVSQAYCSALPVAYSRIDSELWAGFAQLVLQASYEATFCAAILNYHTTGQNKVFLTLLGGGAFGNTTSWIINAIDRALKLYRHVNLEVAIVSHGGSKEFVQELIRRF